MIIDNDRKFEFNEMRADGIVIYTSTVFNAPECKFIVMYCRISGKFFDRMSYKHLINACDEYDLIYSESPIIRIIGTN